MPSFNFLNLRKDLPQKEYAKLVATVIQCFQDFEEWEGQASKFLSGAKPPSRSAGDIDKMILQAESVITAASKALPATASKADKDKMLQVVDGMRGLKIEHRQLVGTLVSHFEGLDASGGKEVSSAAKEVFALQAACKKAAKTKMEELVALVSSYQKKANTLILKHGGYVHSQRSNREDTQKLLGRPLKSAVDEKEFKDAQTALAELGELLEGLERAEKIIKKA